MPKQVMIADDDVRLVEALSSRCEHLGLDVLTASDGMEVSFELFVDPADRVEPDLIILDVNMPIDDGLTICELLARDRQLALIPVIILTGRSDEETIRRCHELGAHYILKGPDLWQRVEPVMSRLLGLTGSTTPQNEQSRQQDAPSVLCIDDNTDFLHALELRLGARGFKVLTADNVTRGYWQALQSQPNVIVTDYVMPGGYGNYLIRRLKEHPLTQETPIIVLTGRDLRGRPTSHKDVALERQLINTGAESVLTKPCELDDLLATFPAELRAGDALHA